VIAIARAVDQMAGDLGRLRRRFDSNDGWSGLWLVDRLAGHVLTLDGVVCASAGELVAWTYPGDPETADAAIEVVERHAHDQRTRLGLPEPCTGRPWHEVEPWDPADQWHWDRLYGHLPNWPALRMGGPP
jgi:hypothetical protein